MNPTTSPPARHRDVSSYGVGPDNRLIEIRELSFLVGYAPSSIYTMIGRGKLPQPLKVGPGGSNRWTLGDARKLVAAAVAARTPASGTTATPLSS